MTASKSTAREIAGVVFKTLTAEVSVIGLSLALSKRLTALSHVEECFPTAFAAVLCLAATLVRKLALPGLRCFQLPDPGEFASCKGGTPARKSIFAGAAVMQAFSLVAIWIGAIVALATMLGKTL